MRQLTLALLTIGAAGIANAHSLDGEHGLADALWHQVAGNHHLVFTFGLVAGTVALIFVQRWISKHHN